ncbi:MAG: hydantoinase [Candidatus Rokubacteria bacterium 13_1_40CM_68_15]|nr:MAG: hydantoinase [Candidatus Rokubacteria bacterium 13_1_40CM_68_15]
MGRFVRIGIDVGGTFTKAVMVDDDTHAIVGQAVVPTTHTAREGVAAGVIEAFRRVLAGAAVSPGDVVFIAHSTTQATNALLEGDVAAVGVLGMGRGAVESRLARSQTHIGDVELASGRRISAGHVFLRSDALGREDVRTAVEALRDRGMRVIVASDAFSVDDPSAEQLVMAVAGELGLPATGGHEITKLYGLTIRTRTAVINASILPKMMETARLTHESVRAAGITCPLMIMRGDGGVMDLGEVEKRPILTMLSGPAASVAGALMHLRVSDGIFFEVGGTSTNIAVIRNGRPTVAFAEVGGHRTYVSSLDVRVLGVAGGSMVRVHGDRVVDVGPRSAHIAGLPYASFQPAERLADAELVFVPPKAGDPSDYVAVRLADDSRIAITTTDAANALGVVPPGDYAHGCPEAARRALAPLAARVGTTVEEVARRILDVAVAKIVPTIERLIEEYALERDQMTLVGGGGGASALIPYAARRLGLEYRIAENAAVISSIGVALAMVRDSVERVIPNPRPEDLAAIRAEAREAAIRAGAHPASIQVHIEVNSQTQRVRATAWGATEMRARDLLRALSESEASAIAAHSLKVEPAAVRLAGRTGGHWVFVADVTERRLWVMKTTRHPVRVLDRGGFIKVQRADAEVAQAMAATAIDELRTLWSSATLYDGNGVIPPDAYLVLDGQMVELSGMISIDHAVSIAASELSGCRPDEPVVVVAARRARGRL